MTAYRAKQIELPNDRSIIRKSDIKGCQNAKILMKLRLSLCLPILVLHCGITVSHPFDTKLWCIEGGRDLNV